MFWTLVGALIFVFWILPTVFGTAFSILAIFFDTPKASQKPYKAEAAKEESEVMRKAREIGEKKAVQK